MGQELELALKRSIRECFAPGKIQEAAIYALFPGGKRLRPRLALFFAQAFGAPRSHALSFACAIEFIHNYTLIHDDLPAMDDDDMRRGRPTVHKKFGEACAVLAGDALLTHAFELLSRIPKPAISKLVAQAIGDRGVIGGQALDMGLSSSLAPGGRGQGEGDKRTERFFKSMYYLKTGKLFEASVLGGAMLAKRAPGAAVIKKLKDWSYEFGYCFQLADDLQDAKETHRKSVPTLATVLGWERCDAELNTHLKRLKDISLPVSTYHAKQIASVLDEIFRAP